MTAELADAERANAISPHCARANSAYLSRIAAQRHSNSQVPHV